MDRPRRLRRLLWQWGVPLLAVAALGLAVFSYFHTPRDRAVRLTLTAGSAAGTRHDLAEMLRGQVAERGLDLDLRESAGSEEALDWVNTRKVDCALVQGGLSIGDRPNVRQVAGLHIEPLHLLVKRELARPVSDHLTALAGKTVNLGEVGSGTHTLAVAVLEFAGLAPRGPGTPGGYVPVTLCQKALGAATAAAELPDAIFLVSSLPSPPVKHLVTRHGYRLVPLPFGEAFALESLTREDRRQRDQSAHTIDKGRTFAAVIPAFAYGVEPAAPPAPLPTLGNRLLLVAHKDVNIRAAAQLIDALFTTEFAAIIRPPLDTRLMEQPPELPWHNGAELYRQRNRPIVSGDVLNYAQKSTAILAGGLSGLVVLWQWIRARRQAEQVGEFRRLLNQVTKLDDEVMRREESGDLSASALLALRGQLMQLRSDALDRFTEGELEDHDLMASFLAHVSAGRDHINRLIAQHHPSATGQASPGYESRQVDVSSGPGAKSS
jgi:TRAP-type uncharacterized transport system substrate-binding protein